VSLQPDLHEVVCYECTGHTDRVLGRHGDVAAGQGQRNDTVGQGQGHESDVMFQGDISNFPYFIDCCNNVVRLMPMVPLRHMPH